MNASALFAARLLLSMGAAAPAVAQVAPVSDQPVTSVTIIGDTDANKSLAWLWGHRVGSHVKRQAGVKDATYEKGVIEVRSDTGRGFQIAPLLKTVAEEVGVTPLKRIEATIRGRVIPTSSGKVLEVTGTSERLLLAGGAPMTDAEQVLKGVIESSRDGILRFTIAAGPWSSEVVRTRLMQRDWHMSGYSRYAM